MSIRNIRTEEKEIERDLEIEVACAYEAAFKEKQDVEIFFDAERREFSTESTIKNKCVFTVLAFYFADFDGTEEDFLSENSCENWEQYFYKVQDESTFSEIVGECLRLCAQVEKEQAKEMFKEAIAGTNELMNLEDASETFARLLRNYEYSGEYAETIFDEIWSELDDLDREAADKLLEQQD